MLTLSKMARVALLTALVATATVPTRAAELDKLAPADAEVAIVINIKSYLNSALFKNYAEERLKEDLKKNAGATDFLKATGLDPLKDFETITVTFNNITGKEDAKACVIVRGKLDVQKLETAIKTEGKKAGESFKVTTEGDLTIYTIIPPVGQSISGTFVGKETLVVSNNLDYLKDIAARKKLEPGEGAATFKKALAKVSGDNTVTVAAAVTDALREKLGAIESIAAIAANLEALTASVNIDNSIDIQARLHVKDTTTARNLAAQLKGVLPLLKVFATGNEMMTPIAELIVDKVKITTDAKDIVFRAQFPEEDLVSTRERTVKAQVKFILERGNVALKDKEWARADRAFEIIERIDPQSEVGKKGREKTKHLKTGYEALAEKKWSDAETAFNAALKIDPENPVAKDGLAKAKAKKS